MSKFVGKFRKNKDYNDDYNYAKNYLHNKHRRSEHAEVKKYIRNSEDEWLEKNEILPDEKQ